MCSRKWHRDTLSNGNSTSFLIDESGCYTDCEVLIALQWGKSVLWLSPNLEHNYCNIKHEPDLLLVYKAIKAGHLGILMEMYYLNVPLEMSVSLSYLRYKLS